MFLYSPAVSCFKSAENVYKYTLVTPTNAKKVISKAKPIQVRKVCVLLLLRLQECQ